MEPKCTIEAILFCSANFDMVRGIPSPVLKKLQTADHQRRMAIAIALAPSVTLSDGGSAGEEKVEYV